MTPKGQSQSSDQSFEPPPRAETLPIGPAAAPSSFAPSLATAGRHSIDLQIDELVVEGVSTADRHTISEAVERELTRLFAEQGVPPAITYRSEIAEVDGGGLEPDPTSNADAIGARVARAIYGGLSR